MTSLEDIKRVNNKEQERLDNKLTQHKRVGDIVIYTLLFIVVIVLYTVKG